MPVTFRLSAPLRPFTAGQERVAVREIFADVGEALEALCRIHPALRDRVLTEEGEIRPHVNLFVGNENIRHTGHLKTPLPETCEIFILPAVSGGTSRSLPR